VVDPAVDDDRETLVEIKFAQIAALDAVQRGPARIDQIQRRSPLAQSARPHHVPAHRTFAVVGNRDAHSPSA
jgi:hypothetical protein